MNVSIASTSGSGKTLACGIAIMNRIDMSKKHTQAIYIVNSYENALHVLITLTKLTAFKDTGLIGSAAQEESTFVTHLDYPVLVGTPKILAGYRLLKVFDVSKLSIVVIDDAESVYPSVYTKTHILSAVPECCQVLLMTSKKTITHGASKRVRLFKGNNVFPPNVAHFYSNCPTETSKYAMLRNICIAANEHDKKQKMIIFVEVRITQTIVDLY